MENMDKESHSTKIGADSWAENTPNASKHFSPKCLPKHKSSRFLKEISLWLSLIRGGQASSLTPLHTYEHTYAYSQLKSNRVRKNACGDIKI